MMTQEWLLTQLDTVMQVPQPQAFQKTGRYPQQYTVQYEAAKQE
jgi:hypothetical protein